MYYSYALCTCVARFLNTMQSFKKGKEEIHKYMQYETSMTVYMGKAASQRKVTKWLSFTKL